MSILKYYFLRYNIIRYINLVIKSRVKSLKVIKVCESTVYTTNGTKIMEDVINIKIDGKEIHLVDILGSQKDLKGVIVEIDLDKHGIFIDTN